MKIRTHRLLLAGFLLPLCSYAQLGRTNITNNWLAGFNELTLHRVDDLKQYIAGIVDMKRPIRERQKAVELATNLFAQPDGRQVFIDVSRKSGQKRMLTAGQYFRNLMGSRYNHIELVAFDVVALTNGRKDEHGHYLATVNYYYDCRKVDNQSTINCTTYTQRIMSVPDYAVAVYPTEDELDIKIYFGNMKLIEASEFGGVRSKPGKTAQPKRVANKQ